MKAGKRHRWGAAKPTVIAIGIGVPCAFQKLPSRGLVPGKVGFSDEPGSGDFRYHEISSSCLLAEVAEGRRLMHQAAIAMRACLECTCRFFKSGKVFPEAELWPTGTSVGGQGSQDDNSHHGLGYLVLLENFAMMPIGLAACAWSVQTFACLYVKAGAYPIGSMNLHSVQASSDRVPCCLPELIDELHHHIARISVLSWPCIGALWGEYRYDPLSKCLHYGHWWSSGH